MIKNENWRSEAGKKGAETYRKRMQEDEAFRTLKAKQLSEGQRKYHAKVKKLLEQAS